MKHIIIAILLSTMIIACGKTPAMQTHSVLDKPGTMVYDRQGEYLPIGFEQIGDVWVENYTNETGNYYTLCEKDERIQCRDLENKTKVCTKEYFYHCKTTRS